MSAETIGVSAQYKGRTTIRPQAIRRVVEAVTAEVAGVHATLVRAALSDEDGALAVSVTTAVGLASEGDGTLLERAGTIAETVRSRLDAIGGRAVGRVDVRLSGIRRAERGRVR